MHLAWAVIWFDQSDGIQIARGIEPVTSEHVHTIRQKVSVESEFEPAFSIVYSREDRVQSRGPLGQSTGRPKQPTTRSPDALFTVCCGVWLSPGPQRKRKLDFEALLVPCTCLCVSELRTTNGYCHWRFRLPVCVTKPTKGLSCTLVHNSNEF